jgi:DNA-binding NarL/FixJ family response regulator
MVLSMVNDLLMQFHFDVVETISNGKEALEAAKEFDFDLILIERELGINGSAGAGSATADAASGGGGGESFGAIELTKLLRQFELQWNLSCMNNSNKKKKKKNNHPLYEFKDNKRRFESIHGSWNGWMCE